MGSLDALFPFARCVFRLSPHRVIFTVYQTMMLQQEFAQRWYQFACNLALTPQAVGRLARLAEGQIAHVQVEGTEPDGWTR